MIYTNVANLPLPLVSAVKFSDYDLGQANISVSGLIQPPRIRQLTIRHQDEIIEDVSEGIWRLIGSIGHKILERADTHNHLAEERLMLKRGEWTVTGKADLLGPDMTLDDYKFRSVWAMKYAKIEDEQQLNMYALLYRENGFNVKQARIIGVLRDWSKPKSRREPDDYPQVGVVVREIPLWADEIQNHFLADRLTVHEFASHLPDDKLPHCTDEETWKKPDVWAVKRKGRKRALPGGLHSTEPSAVAWAAINAGPTEIEYRPGSYPRCELYCPVSKWCNQYAARLPKVTSEPEEDESL